MPNPSVWNAAIVRLLAWACLIWLAATAAAAARDISALKPDEILTLQQRLADAGCYPGAFDGQPSAAVEAAVRACPDQEPILRIETGMHIGPMKALDVDAACKIIITGSDDKTARLWSVEGARLLRVLRMPVGAGNGGKVFAAAVSPDGGLAAFGGWDARDDISKENSIYVHDIKTGAFVARLTGFTDIVIHLTFSPDGRWLAATGGPFQGVRVFDARSWRLAFADPAGAVDTESAAFAPDGRLFTIARDGQLHAYGPGPAFAKLGAINVGHAPHSIAIDPQGQNLAVGFLDLASVMVIDARSLRPRYTTASLGGGNLEQVAWSANGDRLVAAGLYGNGADKDRPFALVTFARDSRQAANAVNVADNSITGLAPCGDGFVFSAFDRGFGLVTAANALGYRPTVAADLRDKIGEAFTISPDAMKVRLGLRYGGGEPALFDPLAETVSDSPVAAPGFLPPRIDGLPVAHWRNDFAPTFAGRWIELNHGETARSLAISPTGDGFVLGTSFRLRGYDARGVQIWQQPAPGDTWGVNISQDGRLIVAAFGDGTVRWKRRRDGVDVLSMFVDVADRRWIAWTPSGYYMASPGAEDLIGWQLNRGWDRTPDFFSAARNRDRFSRPDIVRLVLETLDEGEAVRRANEIARRHESGKPLEMGFPPVARIAGVDDGAGFAEPMVSIPYALRSPSNLPIDRVEALIDGRPVKEIALAMHSGVSLAELTGAVKIELPPRNVEVGLIAWSGDLSSAAAKVHLKWTGAPPPEPRRRLFALIVGVGDYAAPEMALEFAAKDAHDFARALSEQKNVYYTDVVTKVIDARTTRASLIEGLEWLEKQAPGPDDVSVLFMAGHGLTDEKQTYWFLPSDATQDDARAKAVSRAEIGQTLQNLRGKVLWFLDTCHSGDATRLSPVEINALVNAAAAPENGGVVTFASSTGREVSVESGQWRNGAFTAALVEAVEQGRADLARDGDITTSELNQYVSKRVGELSSGKQHPVMRIEQPDFVFAQSRKP